MEYMLRNGNKILIRRPTVEDAEAIVHIMSVADTETRFLARNPGEFTTTVEREREIIANVLENKDSTWFVAVYKGEVIGQCSVGLIHRNARYRHRAEVAFVILKDYCDLGIGGKMMQECINWCKDKGVTQVELDVVKDNERALQMYQSFHFEIIGTTPNALRYPDGSFADEYRMVKYI